MGHELFNDALEMINESLEEQGKKVNESDIKKNILALKGYLASMNTAIEKAERGSTVEDDYFLEKLAKCAWAMGFELTPEPKDEIDDKDNEQIEPTPEELDKADESIEEAKKKDPFVKAALKVGSKSFIKKAKKEDKKDDKNDKKCKCGKNKKCACKK